MDGLDPGQTKTNICWVKESRSHKRKPVLMCSHSKHKARGSQTSHRPTSLGFGYGSDITCQVLKIAATARDSLCSQWPQINSPSPAQDYKGEASSCALSLRREGRTNSHEDHVPRELSRCGCWRATATAFSFHFPISQGDPALL